LYSPRFSEIRKTWVPSSSRKRPVFHCCAGLLARPIGTSRHSSRRRRTLPFACFPPFLCGVTTTPDGNDSRKAQVDILCLPPTLRKKCIESRVLCQEKIAPIPVSEGLYFRNSSTTGTTTSGFFTGRSRVRTPSPPRCASAAPSASRIPISDASFNNCAYSTFPARPSR